MTSPDSSTVAPLIDMFVLKVTHACNMACDYCYMLPHSNRRITLDVSRQTGRRLAEHAALNDLEEVEVSLHGGEPLLLGLPFLGQVCDELAYAAPPLKMRFSLQTNGALLDEAALEFCIARNISVGLSLDGKAPHTARHRKFKDRQSSFEQITKAANLLASAEGRKIWAGFLSVIDITSDPLETYQFLRSFTPPAIEFLLPLGNYSALPPGKDGSHTSAPYAEWLLKVFSVWYGERPQTTMIRRFRDVIAYVAGGSSSSEEFGPAGMGCLVIDCDGRIEAVDTLRTAFPGAADLDCNVFDNSIADATAQLKATSLRHGWDTPREQCASCEIFPLCGGGYLPHRYSRENGFANPSVYCADLATLIETVIPIVEADLRALRLRSTSLPKNAGASLPNGMHA